MHILVVDYLSPKEHTNFDLIHIKSLLELGHDLHLVGREGQFPRVAAYNEVQITQIPEEFYGVRSFHSLTDRIQGIRILRWVKRNIPLDDYDQIVFLSYDILSIFCFKTSVKVFLVNHNNVDQFDSKIKLYLTRNLPDHYIHIALNEYMEAKLKECLLGKKVQYVPHGYLEPSGIATRPSTVKEDSLFVFCPVNRNYDAELINELVNSSLLNDYLRENNITVYVKSQLISVPTEYVHVIGMLTDEEYNYMLTNAMAVLLPYGEEFRYRCSGILFECVARNTPIIATEREALKIYHEKINIHFFKDSESLIGALKKIIDSEKKTFNTVFFQPTKYWVKVLL